MKFRTWLRQEADEFWLGLTHTNDVFSSTKFFSSIAYIAATWVVIHQELASTLSTELFLIYLGVVAGHNVLLRRFASKEEDVGPSKS